MNYASPLHAPNTAQVMRESASQTAGPYVHIGLAPHAAGFDIFANNFGATIAGPETKGQRIRVEGIVYDGSGTPVRDVLIETWRPTPTAGMPTPATASPARRSTRAFAAGRAAAATSPPASTPSTPSSPDR